jgi:hypothetical protein
VAVEGDGWAGEGPDGRSGLGNELECRAVSRRRRRGVGHGVIVEEAGDGRVPHGGIGTRGAQGEVPCRPGVAEDVPDVPVVQERVAPVRSRQSESPGRGGAIGQGLIRATGEGADRLG